ncbi:hypothetical protein VL23_10070 [Stenotrophomonas maltophilia]|uniref:Uncharacterized protein n=1 Tax=Stenotrophomonas maltophilia TaxID=40324 RepID=A0AB34TKL1_STEMA|nr:hypothetical protein VL23_10070 [Stenotrophomonas maltophilia]
MSTKGWPVQIALDAKRDSRFMRLAEVAFADTAQRIVNRVPVEVVLPSKGDDGDSHVAQVLASFLRRTQFLAIRAACGSHTNSPC